MKAIVYERYGPPSVLQLREVDKPQSKPDEVLIQVQAATVAAGDWRMRRPSPAAARLYNGLLRPRRVQILGFELAGRVETAGRDVTRFHPGDDVFAFTGFGFGAHAEYRCLREQGKPQRYGLLARMPGNMTYEEAAAVPVGALTAQAMLRRAGVGAGQRVLVYGASGSVGTYAVQMCANIAADTTGVCSTANLELVRSLGAKRVVDYTKQDFDQLAGAYDLVFDAVGKLAAPSAKRLLASGGRFLSVMGSAKLEPDDLEQLRQLIEAGRLRAVIDRRYPLEDAAQAHEYVEGGHKKGNVVLTVASPTH